MAEDDRQGVSGGGGLLGQISTEMVGMMKRYYGKGPTQAKSYLLDDFLIVVMRGGETRAEQTMLAADRGDAVRAFRQEYENEMAKPLVEAVERMTGRKVVTYQSQVLFEPHIAIEIFFFDDVLAPEMLQETIRALMKSDGGGSGA